MTGRYGDCVCQSLWVRALHFHGYNYPLLPYLIFLLFHSILDIILF